jgi:nucleotide-binding universal stress UspA family protein
MEDTIVRTILAATDLSLQSDRALHRTALLARQFGARLVLLHVVAADQRAEIIAKQMFRATVSLGNKAAHLAELADADLWLIAGPAETAMLARLRAWLLGALIGIEISSYDLGVRGPYSGNHRAIAHGLPHGKRAALVFEPWPMTGPR